MRRGRILILFALIVLFGVVALYLFLRPRAEQPGEGGTPAAPADTTFIVIALQDISRGSQIPADAVGTSPYPRDMVVETMIERDTALVVGRYARQAIPRGAPITSGMITRQTGDLLPTGSDASIAIPPGFTAITVPMNRLTGVGYALRDGDRVDVLISMLLVDLNPDFQTLLPDESLILLGPGGELLTGMICQELKVGDRGPECINPEPPPAGRVLYEEETGVPIFAQPSEPQRPRLITQRLIQNATVLRVGSFTYQGQQSVTVAPAQPTTTEPVEGQTTTTTVAAQAVPPPDIITLIVTPQDALALNWALCSGAHLTFTLRAPGDGGVSDTLSVTLQYLVQNYNITVPTRLPYGLMPRLDAIIEPVLPNDMPVVPTQ